jgi:dihydroorotate dehydrogenase
MACVSAATAGDFPETAGYVADHGATLVLLDFSCRATPDNRFIGYNIKLSEQMMTETRSTVSVPLGVKVPILLDYLNVEAMARAATKTGMDFVVAVAPAGTALAMDSSGQSVLRTPDGLGEMAGHVIKHMALANVRVFHQITGGRLPIIGSGGVSTGQDALDFLLAGASGVQVGTSLPHQGRSPFTEMEESLSGLLGGMGFCSAAAAVGQMRELSPR